MTGGWITRQHWRPPLLVAAVTYALQAEGLIGNRIDLWPHYGSGAFWPGFSALVAATCLGTALNLTFRSRFFAACMIVSFEMIRALAVFAAAAASPDHGITHIIARNVLIAFLAAYLLLDED